MSEFACSVVEKGRVRIVIPEYSHLFSAFQKQKDWRGMSEMELWHELCLCILSSNVVFETAESAFLQLREKGLLDLRRIGEFSAEDFETELSRPIYLPRRKDGSFRVYRFPRSRAMDILAAQDFLYVKNCGLRIILEALRSGAETRGFLARSISGVGLKQASHFLRNIKFSDSLAIVDSHVVRFLSGGILEDSLGHITHKRYAELEEEMKEISRKHGVNPSLLDIAIWNHMRRMHP